jgi:cell division septation protein DedD
MREEPKLFGGGTTRPQPEPETHLSILGIEPEESEAEGDYYDDEVADDYEAYDESPRRRVPWKIIAALAAVAVGGIAAGMFLGVAERPVQLADVPLITADPSPFKHRPDDPGGLEVPYQDVEVFGTLNEEAGAGDDDFEILLPEPEEPLETMPEETVVEQADGGASLVDLGEATPGDDVVDPGIEPGAMAEAVEGGLVPPLPTLPPERLDYVSTIDAAETQPQTEAQSPSDEAPSGELSFDDVAASLSGGETTQPQTVAPAAGGPKVQVAAYGSEQNARDAWAFLQDKNWDLLAAYQPIIDTAVLASGTFYRLQIGPFASDTEARRLCDSLRSRQVDCVIVAP